MSDLGVYDSETFVFNHELSYFTTSTNLDMAYRKFSGGEEEEVRGVIVLVHGLHEHSGRYTFVADSLVREGYVVYAPDLVGHGKSGGDRGVIRSFSDVVVDVEDFILHVSELESRSIFLMAHSMGSVIATLAHLNLKNKGREVVSCVVFTGYALKPGKKSASPFGIEALYCINDIECLTHCLLPCLTSLDPLGDNSPIDTSALSRNPHVEMRLKSLLG